MYLENRKLKEARINSGMSVHDMAYLLDIDSSNLSKYEKGLLKPSRELLYGYHLITGVQFGKLQKSFFSDFIDRISLRMTKLISRLEERKPSQKMKFRMEQLNEILENMACIRDNNESHE